MNFETEIKAEAPWHRLNAIGHGPVNFIFRSPRIGAWS